MKVRAQAAARHSLAPAVRCRHRSPRRERHDLFAVGDKETVGVHKQRANPMGSNDAEQCATAGRNFPSSWRETWSVTLSALKIGKMSGVF